MPEPAPVRLPSPRYRRRILAGGLIAAGALYSFVAPAYVGGIEEDLEERVPEELSEDGFDGVTAEFSGQDGTLRCAQPLTDPEAAGDAAYEVWGVRAITVDRSCRVNSAVSVGGDDGAVDAGGVSPLASATDDRDGTVGSSVAVTADVGFVTVDDLLGSDPRFSYLSVLLDESGLATWVDDPSAAAMTMFAPTDEAFERLPADANALLRSDPDLLARVLDHHITTGALLASDLTPGPLTMVDDSMVEITVDGSSITVDGAALVEPDLSAGNGVVHGIDHVLIPDDVVLEEPEPATTVATSVEVVVTTPAEPTEQPASADDAAALTAELNEYVAANPLRFQPAQAVLAPDSAPVLDHIAARLLESTGIAVTIEGHTDSDGTPARNLTLSQQRAEAVLLALVARGLTDVAITAEGFGSERPVLVNGVEDKAASRRVEFRVEALP